MREIKYQAWDTQDKRMISWQELLDYGSGFVEYLINPRELIFREYTGLKDKNGKEIYEGDIFRYELLISHIRLTKIIEWEEDSACFFLWDGDADKEQSRFSKGLASHGEVIGNIYENPELLGVKSK